MKILGGSFGVNGIAFISRDRKLVVEGATKGIYGPDQVLSASASVSKEKKFGFLPEIRLLPMPFWLAIGKINVQQMYYWKLAKLWAKMCEKENRCAFQKQVGVLGIPMIERLLKNRF